MNNKSNRQTELSSEAKQRREVFARFGLAMYQAQCVERQIAILNATTLNPKFFKTPPEERQKFFEFEFSKTLGRLCATLTTKIDIPSNLETRLARAIELRNWLAHKYFWERPGSILNWNGREQMIAELQEAIEFLDALDNKLTDIILHWLEKSGVPKETIDKEMQKYLQGENNN